MVWTNSKLSFAQSERGAGDIGEYVDNDGGGKVGLVRCCDGVVDRSINIRLKIPLFEAVEAAEEARDRLGRSGIGAKSGTSSALEYTSSSTSYSGVLTSPPLTARAWAAAVWLLGRLIAARAGASSNVEGGLRTREGISAGTERDGWGFKEVVCA